jgi:3-hydroxyisobutyrate dehydrogenase-like beta-hydroxyacid dehydrogenase
MMRNLLRHNFEVVGYDIADGAIARLAEAGGIAATSPRDVAEKAEILITSLPNVDSFEQVMAGQGGIASSNGAGQIVIECPPQRFRSACRAPAGAQGGCPRRRW